jgi:DNA-binding transcriptional MerR regulator
MEDEKKDSPRAVDLLDKMLGERLKEVQEDLLSRFATIVEAEVRKATEGAVSTEVPEKRYMNASELSRASGISRQTIHSLVKRGALSFYKLPDSSKKLYLREDLDALIERVEVPVHQNDDYGSFEARVRKAAKRGERLQKRVHEYKRRTTTPSLSGLAQYLYEQGDQDLIKGALPIDLDN